MNKYRNRKVIVDGIKFDSKKEAKRYKELKLMERSGMITDLKLQVPFKLQDTFKCEGVTHRAIRYIADFVYFENGKLVVEDAKGIKTKEYLIKRKMFAKKFCFNITEV